MKIGSGSPDFMMRQRTQFVARRCDFPALRGPDRETQGIALGIDGNLYESAL
jgi:hypothetical protein